MSFAVSAGRRCSANSGLMGLSSVQHGRLQWQSWGLHFPATSAPWARPKLTVLRRFQKCESSLVVKGRVRSGRVSLPTSLEKRQTLEGDGRNRPLASSSAWWPWSPPRLRRHSRRAEGPPGVVRVPSCALLRRDERRRDPECHTISLSGARRDRDRSSTRVDGRSAVRSGMEGNALPSAKGAMFPLSR